MADIIPSPAKQEETKEQLIKLVTSDPRNQTLEDKQKDEAVTLHKKRKRRHHRKQKAVRDPQQIKSIRLQRLNIKREVHWDCRFVNDTIPDLFRPKKRRIDRANRSRPLQSAYVEKDRPKLPELVKERHETASKSNHRSFKIRQVKKEAETTVIPAKEEEAKRETIQEQAEKISKKISRKERHRQRLLLKLQEKIKIFPISKHYKQLIIDLISKATDKKHKPVRVSIQRQIDSIGGNDNVYSRLQRLVQERRAMLKNIKASGASAILKAYLDFQIHSLALIEQVLKFKAFWEAIYHDYLQTPTKVNFYYDDSNYLLEVNTEVADIAQNDPFLIEKTANLQKLINSEPKEQQMRERKQMMLKIRACELLLIEQELHANL